MVGSSSFSKVFVSWGVRRVRALAATLLILVGLLLVPSCLTAQVSVTMTRLGDRGLGTAEVLASQTDELIREIDAKLGLGFDGELSLVLCTTVDSFNGYSSSYPGAHSEVFGFFASPEIIRGGMAVPTIALNLELIVSSGARPREVYKHELVHAVLHQNILWRLRALWFEEGVAQWVSKTPLESALREMGHASGTGEDPTSLNQVSWWMRDPVHMGDAYAHGLAAVQMMAAKHGEDGMRRLLAAMKAESSGAGSTARFEELYNTVFSSSFSAFQDAFIEKRRRTDWGRVISFVGANMWALLMLIGTALIYIGVRRKQKREAQMIESWDRIDQDYPPDPDYAIAASAPEDPDEDPIEAALAAHDDMFDDPLEDAMDEHRREFGDEGEGWRTKS